MLNKPGFSSFQRWNLVFQSLSPCVVRRRLFKLLHNSWRVHPGHCFRSWRVWMRVFWRVLVALSWRGMSCGSIVAELRVHSSLPTLSRPCHLYEKRRVTVLVPALALSTLVSWFFFFFVCVRRHWIVLHRLTVWWCRGWLHLSDTQPPPLHLLLPAKCVGRKLHFNVRQWSWDIHRRKVVLCRFL